MYVSNFMLTGKARQVTKNDYHLKDKGLQSECFSFIERSNQDCYLIPRPCPLSPLERLNQDCWVFTPASPCSALPLGTASRPGLEA